MLKVTAIKKQMPVEMEVEAGQSLLFSIREFTGDQRDTYFARMAEKYGTDEKGETVVKSYKGTYSLLLALTMYDANDKLVPEATIQSWPDTTQKALFEAAQEVCGMKDVPTEGDEKKD